MTVDVPLSEIAFARGRGRHPRHVPPSIPEKSLRQIGRRLSQDGFAQATSAAGETAADDR